MTGNADSPAGSRPVFLTFAPMVDSETSRLLLHHYGVDYEERDHLLPWVMLLALLHGGTGKVPLLYGRGVRVTGPLAIARHFDDALPPDCRLVPPDGPLAAQVKADWDMFNGGMGADTAAFAYFHLLPERRLMSPIFAAPLPPLEAWLEPAFYPLLAGLIRIALHLSPQSATAAADHIRAAFEATDKRVADGRPYLCGDRLTIGDIALAAAAGPLLLPPGYGAEMPPLDKMPAPVSDLIEELRAHPTGRFVARLYAEGFEAARQKAA
ncbi:MAG TPA: glutathione S-transferase C-terminal domain-containing protein [Allosphingosinicella sp.]|nr:glutathione S-transferase C-terminal domain-containing protein [Allosphingosinicella sp.]